MSKIARNGFYIGALLFVFSTVGIGETIRVPQDEDTIFSAILAAKDGDTVLVSPGSYSELPLHFFGKAIAVRSVGGPNVTVIKGRGSSVVSFIHGEDSNSILEGFTITNGSRKSGGGGGIFCRKSSPTIINNNIGGNSALMGGGIYCEYASPRIENNLFIENTAEYGGGLFCCLSSHPEILNNRFVSNYAVNADKTDFNGGGGIYCAYNSYPIIDSNEFFDNFADFGGGLFCNLYSSPKITNNVFAVNDADYGAGICCFCSFPIITCNTISMNTANNVGGGIFLYKSRPPITNTIIWDNRALAWSGHERYNEIYFQSVQSGPNVNFCVVKNGWTKGEGNIDEDPLFVDSSGGDFHLQPGSPCIDAGDNNATGLPETDYEGDERIIDGDLDGEAVVDIGADEHL